MSKEKMIPSQAMVVTLLEKFKVKPLILVLVLSSISIQSGAELKSHPLNKIILTPCVLLLAIKNILTSNKLLNSHLRMSQ